MLCPLLSVEVDLQHVENDSDGEDDDASRASDLENERNSERNSTGAHNYRDTFVDVSCHFIHVSTRGFMHMVHHVTSLPPSLPLPLPLCFYVYMYHRTRARELWAAA
jgi:hypothetical protein